MGHNHPFNMAGDPTASKHTPWVFQDDVVNPARFASESNRLVKCWSAVTDCCWKKQVQYMLHMMSSWWFQPFWKILVKFGSFPKVCVKIGNIWNHYLNAYWIIIWGLFWGPKVLEHVDMVLNWKKVHLHLIRLSSSMTLKITYPIYFGCQPFVVAHLYPSSVNETKHQTRSF